MPTIGTVIHGTLRPQDLIPAFSDELCRVDPKTDLLFALNDRAPLGCYFGAHWGDGADFGYWPSEED